MKVKVGGVDTKKLVLLNLLYILVGYFCDEVAWLRRVAEGNNASDKMMAVMNSFDKLFANPLPSFHPRDLLIGVGCGIVLRLVHTPFLWFCYAVETRFCGSRYKSLTASKTRPQSLIYQGLFCPYCITECIKKAASLCPRWE